MKQLHRIVVVFFLVFFVAGFACAQSEDNGIINRTQIDTCKSFLDGKYFLQWGIFCFNAEWFFESYDHIKHAISSFEQNLVEHPCHDSTAFYLGYSYYYLILLNRADNNGEYYEKALCYLPNTDTLSRFVTHCYYGQYLLSSDSLSGIEPDYCKAFNEFNKAMECIVDIDLNTNLLPLYKELYYRHACLLFDSYYNSISLLDTTTFYKEVVELPDWVSCMGEQPLDRCIDDLSRLVNIDQEDIEKNNYDTLALVLLGECYSYKGEYEKAKECYEKWGNPTLYAEKTFLKHYNQAVSLYNGDTLNCVEPDYCGAFQEFETILGSDAGFEKDSLLFPYIKSILYLHADLLLKSYCINIPDTTNTCGLNNEIPEWDSCIGDQQLDRCIDDLHRIIHLGQSEGDTNNLDTLALVMLGECHYYKKEYKKATECYEKSGVSPEHLDIRAAFCFWHSYILIGINDERYDALLGQIIEAYRNNYALYHLLYRDVSDDKLFGKEGDSKDVDESLLKSVHTFLLYYIGKKEYDKALDFWLKIKNNFSLSPILLMDQAFCRMYLGDFSAISDFAYAYNLKSLRKVPEKDQLNDDVDPFKIIKDAYNDIALSALYIEGNYEDAREYYSAIEKPTPEENLMLGVCYKKLNKEEGAKRCFYEVISMEDSIGKISETPYAYLFLGESDKAVESMENLLNTGFPSKICNKNDSLDCFGIHYQAAEIYAKVGRLGEAQWHISKALEYYHDPWALATALKMPLLDTIRNYIEQEVNRYRENLGILESKILRDTIVCDIPFKKSSDYTRTVKCKLQMNNLIKEIELLFDPGADKCQFNIDDAKNLGITNNDIIACIPLKDANGMVVIKPLVSLNKVTIGDIELENVQAVIDSTSNAKSLLGCTVLNNLKVEMPSPVNKGEIRFTYVKESIIIPESKKTLKNN